MPNKTAPRNYIGEWFGRRIFPTVDCTAKDVADMRQRLCPFLTTATRRETKCIKNANSLGVCTITTTSGKDQDWMVCPYRALHLPLLQEVVSRLFGQPTDYIVVYPVVSLSDEKLILQMRRESASGKTVFIFIQDKLGGEINVTASDKSPELSFDITIMPIKFDGDSATLGQFAFYEVQTMDFHGSYAHAVRALMSAVDLHKEHFATVLKDNLEWAGRSIEGPNIANVFKRTFYQIILKFQLAGEGDCVGAALGIPSAVWDSWSPHLGQPRLVRFSDHSIIRNSRKPNKNSWIYVFKTVNVKGSTISDLVPEKVLHVDVQSLLKSAFVDVPEHIARNQIVGLKESILARVRKYYPQVGFAPK